MDVLPKHSILEFHPDTFQVVRKINGFDNCEAMKEAVEILNEWAKQQNHFMKKEFRKEYLERLIITSKGSIERAKKHLDKLCTFRTLVPQFFEDVRIGNPYKVVTLSILPKLTNEHCRVIIVKCSAGQYEPAVFTFHYKFFLMLFEYLKVYDYHKCFIFILDMMEANLSQILSNLSVTETRQLFNIMMEGYGGIMKGIYLLTNSKLIDTLVVILRQLMSAKLGQRIQVHNSIESIHDFITPKDILPEDYGGTERSMAKLCDDWEINLNAKDFTEHLKEMNEARTNESYRPTHEFDQQNMGISGTFRSLSVD